MLAAIVLAGVAPGISAVTVTIGFSTKSIAVADLDGNPATGDWSDAALGAIPLENSAAAPYDTATLYAKHDGTYLYVRIDGQIDVPWTSSTGNHFWLGFMLSPPAITGHHKTGQDDVFFGETSYSVADYLSPIDTNGGLKPPALDAHQDAVGHMGYTGTVAPYSFTAEWRRPLNSGDSQDIVLVADGSTSYNFYSTTDSDGGGSSGGAIDHSSLSHDNFLVLAAAPAPTVHDVAVTAAAASPTSVFQGASVTVTATVQNQGTAAETFPVNAFAGSLSIGSQTVTSLAAGASTGLTFTWNTATVAPGSYAIRVEAPPLSGETDTADNSFTDGTVVVNAVVHDVAITAASATPLSALVGTPVSISATAANLGTQAETFGVTAYAGSVTVGTQTVTSLGAGATKALTFPWATASATAGSYPVRVSAAAVSGETSLANNDFTDGTVVLTAVVHDVAVTTASATPLSGTVGVVVAISATVQNQGTQAETFDVKAYAGTILVGTQTMTSLAAGASPSLSFSWNTAGVAPGSYAVRVDASAVAGETDLADNSFADGSVSLAAVVVHDVAVTGASATPLAALVGASVTIAATVQNQGTQAETFDVTAYAGAILVGTQTVTSLGAGASKSLSFAWDTSAAAAGSYSVRVSAGALAGETDLADNSFTDGNVVLTAVVHDVAITSASASPLSGLVGASISITAVAANLGTQAESFAVTATAGAITVGTQSVSSLGAGTSQTLTFAWDTTTMAAGSYPIRVSAAAVAGETNMANNAFDDGTVVLTAPVHDVAISSVSVNSLTGLVGDTFTISVTASNLGTQSETFDVTAFANGLAIGTKSATVAAAASSTVSISWATAGLSAGAYAISATASPVPGETNLADNSLADGTVTLSVPPPATPSLKLGRIWPDWRRAPAGTAQTFFGKVTNLGTVGAYAQIVYDIYDKATGLKVATGSSSIVWVPAGNVSGDTTFQSPTWTGTPGIYTVVGTLYFGTDAANLNLVDGMKQISRFAIL